MANNSPKNTNDILVKIDKNNLLVVDPNSVVYDGNIYPREVQPENFVMYVNLEADLIPRTTLLADNQQNTITSVAKGEFNMLKNFGEDFNTKWTDTFFEVNQVNKIDANGQPNTSYNQYDSTGQNFGIESISIRITGANAIPKVDIKFVDVGGRTLFTSPENSPYNAFFHLPWPIFYLTIKGYFGKAIRYRLHLVKFNSRYNSENGNFEITTTFIGSTQAFLSDIPLEAILNAPYMFPIENVEDEKTNNGKQEVSKRVRKTSKGFSTLLAVYDEYKAKKLIDNDLPPRTLREIIIIAGRLNKILEKQIFSEVINHKVLAAVKEFGDTINDLNDSLDIWKSKVLSTNFQTTNNVNWYPLKNKQTFDLTYITGTKDQSLESYIKRAIDSLKNNEAFGENVDKKLLGDDLLKPISLNKLKDITQFYKTTPEILVAFDYLKSVLDEIYKNFNEQYQVLEDKIESKMNQIFYSKSGFGFQPTIRNIFGIILANAETYIRLMKEVHDKAFEQTTNRQKFFNDRSIENDGLNQEVYPWPQVKVASTDKNTFTLKYPGSKDLIKKLNSNDKILWPEVDFVENFYAVATKVLDSIEFKEGSAEKINFLYESNKDFNEKFNISSFTSLIKNTPYSNKSISNIIYELYERSKYITDIESFDNSTVIELAEIEYENLKTQISEDYDIIDYVKKHITSIPSLLDSLKKVSPNERWLYQQDQLPTIQYLKDTLQNDFDISKYQLNTNTDDKKYKYQKLNNYLTNYQAEKYRKSIYPFNSDTYLSYINTTSYNISELDLKKSLQVNTIDGFIISKNDVTKWVKTDYKTNLFNSKLKIGDTQRNILNTPYFHKKLYEDFSKTASYGKYAASSYLLLTSLPFLNLDDKNEDGVRVSSLFKEVGATHFLPYHLILKWGAIYHRYKKYLKTGVDILSSITTPINTNLYFDGTSNRTYTINGNSVTQDSSDYGIYPLYHSIFHQIVNGYTFFNQSSITGNTAYSNTITAGANKVYSQKNVYDGKTWISLIDNSYFDKNDKRFTLLPSNGLNDISGKNKSFEKQDNFKLIWGQNDKADIIDYSGSTLPAYNQYFLDLSNQYSLSNDYKKVLDLIAVFKPDILDTFEDLFLQFSTEKLQLDRDIKKFDFKYYYFQDLLKAIVSIDKTININTLNENTIIESFKNIQLNNLSTITSELLSNDNIIKLTLGNPKEVDSYILGGFTNVNSLNFSVNSYSPQQVTDDNKKLIELLLGNDLENLYLDFFKYNDIELNEENINEFRPIIYMYAGFIKDKKTEHLKANNNLTGFTYPQKSVFINYLKDNLITGNINPATKVAKSNDRLNLFLNTIITKIRNDLKDGRTNNVSTNFGYNDDPIKVELYSLFKSFNDKWTSGNSIGQRTLLEEFLFLDKANRDIGNKAYIDMERLLNFASPKNKKISLYSALSLLLQDSGFDMRALPAYVNFYGNNYITRNKIVPSKKVAENLFGTFLDVDYQEASPKIIIQYVGPTSKYRQNLNKNSKYKFKDDSFDINQDVDNPVVIANNLYDTVDYQNSNRAVAFEVSFGDQNQTMFKSVTLDQTSIKNTSQSFEVLERLGQSQSGSGTVQIDTGLFDIYRDLSYTCEVTSLGNVMIQPTMYFYLKNVPLFKGTYWITEVNHNITLGSIETTFKGTRLPKYFLTDPKDSFLASYRALFDKILKKAIIKTNQQKALSGQTTIIQDSTGSYEVYLGDKNQMINGEILIRKASITDYKIPYNGYNEENYIGYFKYKNEEWLKSFVAPMGEGVYPINDNTDMYIVREYSFGTNKLKWVDLKNINTRYYSTNFMINELNDISLKNIVENYKTTFLNPKTNTSLILETNFNKKDSIYEGPVHIMSDIVGYGIAMSAKLRQELKLQVGDPIFFKLVKK